MISCRWNDIEIDDSNLFNGLLIRASNEAQSMKDIYPWSMRTFFKEQIIYKTISKLCISSDETLSASSDRTKLVN